MRSKHDPQSFFGKNLPLLAAGLVLPVGFVVMDNVLLSPFLVCYDWVCPLFYAWLACEMVIMSVAVGKYLSNWFWRVIVLSWTLILLNSLLFDRSLAQRWEGSVFDPIVMPFVFVSAQFSLSAVWLVLGAMRWQWRVPVAAAATVPASLLLAEQLRVEGWAGEIWNEVLLLEILLTLVVGCILRALGWRIQVFDEGQSPEAVRESDSLSQFSLADLFVWTGVCALMVLCYNLVGYRFPRHFGIWQWALILAYAGLLASVVFSAIWATLGRGHTGLRSASMGLIAAVAAALLRFVEVVGGTRAGWVPSFGEPIWLERENAYVTKFSDAGFTWLVWTEILSVLCVGMFLVLRVNCYRFVRLRRGTHFNGVASGE
jgi:hypothetical protein